MLEISSAASVGGRVWMNLRARKIAVNAANQNEAGNVDLSPRETVLATLKKKRNFFYLTLVFFFL